MLPTIKGAHFSGFVPAEVAPKLDFLSVHIYPDRARPAEAMAILKQFEVGKPVLIEETFPLPCPMAELADFIEQSRTHACGWLGHYDGEPPAHYAEANAAGAITAAETLWWE